MDISLESIFKQCTFGVDTNNRDCLQILSSNVEHLKGELVANTSVVNTVNILLCEKHGSRLPVLMGKLVVSSFDIESETIAASKLKTLQSLQLLQWPVLYAKHYMKAMIDIIEQKVAALCSSGDYEEDVMSNIEAWLKGPFLHFVEQVVGKHNATSKVKKELRLAAMHALAKQRAKELFEMIAEFPDSLVALKELRDSIKQTDCMSQVGKGFRSVLKKRLLHMGASTTQILDFYVSMIKALRVLDSSDFLLNFAAEPVRSYLLTRKDAVRCIVSSLTEGKQSELHGELKQGGSLAYAADEDDEEGGPGVHWEPRKRNKELVETKENARGLDTLALLVSIYGSTDLFIVEYRSLLADKLMSNLSYGTDNEVANLELLKIRFGEESLHACEVMLKDVEDSKRANNGVHSELLKKASGTGEDGKQVDYTIVSEHYWPSIPREALTYHPTIATLLEAYQSTYAVLKKPRKLHPTLQLGHVEVELEFEDGAVRCFTVTPMQASVIQYFQEPGEHNLTPENVPDNDGDTNGQVTLSLRKLAALSEVDEQDLWSSGLSYWVAKGVVRELSAQESQVISAATGGGESGASGAPFADDTDAPERYFTLVEEQQGLAAMDVSIDIDAQGNQESRMNSAASAQQKAALVEIEGYVKGLLSGHGTMSLERLHNMLKLLSGGSAGTPGDVHFDMTVQQLRQFLQAMVDASKIEYVEGVYALCQAQKQ